ncbi:MAG: basal-body rod modification protein FlgD [Rhodothalassiaceae bacterium]|nr:MAG: basal-body rod modification protein FlgD [Rhodothalassiaceae bacterium]
MEVTPTVPGTAQPSAATAAGNQLAQDFDTFLSLLTTQLQNQDPLDPMDSSEFTNQLVAFAGVEQQIQTNKNLEQLQTQLTAARNAAAVDYIGREVDIRADEGEHDGSGLTFRYDLSRAADRVRLQIVDELGRTVFETDGETGLGSHVFSWPGTDFAGSPAAAGRYGLRVSALDGEGRPVPNTIFLRGAVSAVSFSDGTAKLEVKGNEVGLDEVDLVR